jgi:hypothetical protein
MIMSHVDVMEKLLRYPCDPDVTYRRGETAEKISMRFEEIGGEAKRQGDAHMTFAERQAKVMEDVEKRATGRRGRRSAAILY